MEGLWQTERGAPLLLFAWPDAATRSNRFEIAVPRGASLILTHHLDGEVRGLDDFPDRNPPVAPVFWAFRIMVGMGLAMWLVSWLATLDLRRGEPRPLTTRALQTMMFAGWVAVVAGWYVTEIGRQPFLVYGVLRTADAAGPVPGRAIGLTLAIYVTLYALLIVAFIKVVHHLARSAGATTAPPVPQPALHTEGARRA